MSLKRRAALIVSLVLLTASYSGLAQQAGTRIVVARNHVHAFHTLAPTVALAKGFFEGVRVEILPEDILPEMEKGDELLSAMRAKGVDVVLDARTRAIFNQSSPGPAGLYIIGGWVEEAGGTAKVVGTGDLMSLRDLRGKKVGTSDLRSNSTATLKIWLTRAGLNPERDVTWVGRLARDSRAPEALRRGEVDAAVVGKTVAAELVKEKYRILLDYEKVYPEGLPDWCMVARAELLQKDPKAVKEFLKGMVRAYRLINDWQKNEAFLKPLEQGLIEKASVKEGETYRNTRLLPDARIPLKALQRVLEEEKELQFAKPDIRTESVVNFKPLEEALEELERAKIQY